MVTAVTAAAMWLFEFSVAHLCSQHCSRRARLQPFTQIHCLSLRLNIHIRPAHEHAKHQEYRTCHRLSGSCMCFQPGIPKIKQITISDSKHPNWDGREEKICYFSHTYIFFLLFFPGICLIPLPVRLIGLQQWQGLLFWWCTPPPLLCHMKALVCSLVLSTHHPF